MSFDGPAAKEMLTLTFAVQHNPNCPSPWLIRLPGASGVIDNKPYAYPFGGGHELTGDLLGFGKTFEEAAKAALEESARYQREFIESLKPRP